MSDHVLPETVMLPFNETFPPENIHHHFVGQDQNKGVYAKELEIPAGWVLESHKHSYDHLSILCSGLVAVTIDGVRSIHQGPTALVIKAGQNHTLRAVTNAVWFCIHPTNETDADKVDEVILREV